MVPVRASRARTSGSTWPRRRTCATCCARKPVEEAVLGARVGTPLDTTAELRLTFAPETDSEALLDSPEDDGISP